MNRFDPDLTPAERVSAYLAAGLVGDEEEMRRLAGSAPMVLTAQPHSSRRMQATWSVAALVRLEQFQLTADLWHARTRLAWLAVDALEGTESQETDAASKAPPAVWDAMISICSWRLSLVLDAWKILCQKLDIPEDFLSQFGTCVAMEVAGHDLPSHDSVETEVQEKASALGRGVGAMTTAAEKADEWLKVFDDLGGNL